MYKKLQEEYASDLDDDLIKLLATAGIIIILAICILNIIL